MQRLLPVCAAVLWLAHFALADTITLNPSADTTIADGNGIADLGGTMTTGRINQGATGRDLLQFDLGEIPANATITSVALSVTGTKFHTTSPNIHNLHRLLVPWTEGGATWTSSGLGPWTAGGSFVVTPDATVLITGLSGYTFGSNTSLVKTVQMWLTNGALNRGWLFRNTIESSPGNARRFGTRESEAPPSLTIEYTVPTPPAAPATLSHPRLFAGHLVFEFTAQAGTSYTVQYKGSLNDTWENLQNYSGLEEGTVVTVSDPLTTGKRFYQIVTP